MNEFEPLIGEWHGEGGIPSEPGATSASRAPDFETQLHRSNVAIASSCRPRCKRIDGTKAAVRCNDQYGQKEL